MDKGDLNREIEWLRFDRRVKNLVRVMLYAPVPLLLLRMASLGERPPIIDILAASSWLLCGFILAWKRVEAHEGPKPRVSNRKYPPEEFDAAIDTFAAVSRTEPLERPFSPNLIYEFEEDPEGRGFSGVATKERRREFVIRNLDFFRRKRGE